MGGATLVITKHSRFHRAVVSAAALMTVAGGNAQTSVSDSR